VIEGLTTADPVLACVLAIEEDNQLQQRLKGGWKRSRMSGFLQRLPGLQQLHNA